MFFVISIVVAVLQMTAVTSDCLEGVISPRTLGSDAPAHESTPWQAVIYRKTPDSWVVLCGGTLVSPSHVITAASCFWSRGNRTAIDKAIYKVAVGETCQDFEHAEQDVQMLKVKQVQPHPWFSAWSQSLQHDIAVITLETAANVTSDVSPALMERRHTAGGEHLPTGSFGTMADWEGNVSRSLSSVQLPYLNFRACADLAYAQHGLVPSVDKFCAGAKDAMRTLCRHDIGAGYIYRQPTTNGSVLRGVLSTDLRRTQMTETCQQNDIAGFTNIADPLTLEWLVQIIPDPDVPCPAVETSAAVFYVYCHLGKDELDCSLPMPHGAIAASRCNPGFAIAGNRKSKSATCARDGTWSKAHVVCVQTDPCLPSPCGPYSQCVGSNGHAECSCLPTFLGSPPGCRPECDVSSDCEENRSCVVHVCTDPCVGACALNANCTVVDRTPVCSCLPGYTGDPRANCTFIVRPDYQRFTGLDNYYKFHAAPTTWPVAKTTCETEGSHLVVLNSEAEYQAMINLMKSVAYVNYAWIGVQESSTQQHVFTTVLGGPLASTGFLRWYGGYPMYKSLGDVLCIYPTLDGLFDWQPTVQLGFFCETEVPSS